MSISSVALEASFVAFTSLPTTMDALPDHAPVESTLASHIIGLCLSFLYVWHHRDRSSRESATQVRHQILWSHALSRITILPKVLEERQVGPQIGSMLPWLEDSSIHSLNLVLIGFRHRVRDDGRPHLTL